MDNPVNDITVEALTLAGQTVAVNVIVSGVPLHYCPKTTPMDMDDAPIGPCEVWLHWGHEHGRITRRSLDESRSAIGS